MKKILIFLGGLAFAASAAAADSARLALWITDPVGTTSGIQCDLEASPASAGRLQAMPLPTTPPTLTERDVIAWNRSNGRWTLDSARFIGIESAQRLQDHCFLLAIDGKPVSSGIVLSEYSARLTGFPTLIVINRNDALTFELLSSNHGAHMRHLHAEALDAVLHEKAVQEK
ncbi:hypothetical protein [Noviherbaspirillum autotrophicum]|uniref:Uncharacterized protein n=1 Tax=Noviherbaspirillum autotrophicum TaxID=709839 RepID=A0A0C1YMD3_9BURK|nr:hypothetical protein [Noviherbaspirillum autotrophicum]KIF81697.1 hypothetical protein TSA66_14305 [Noviherbaspirillum autotrophicum]KIF82064.1 hypothetical protein TSA66_16670 [Noviherbaspirillum autotrophicum]KIF84142.1 hypothetical protein TSA66_00350 [Noviherbaspirillum autotrophicum]